MHMNIHTDWLIVSNPVNKTSSSRLGSPSHSHHGTCQACHRMSSCHTPNHGFNQVSSAPICHMFRKLSSKLQLAPHFRICIKTSLVTAPSVHWWIALVVPSAVTTVGLPLGCPTSAEPTPCGAISSLPGAGPDG